MNRVTVKKPKVFCKALQYSMVNLIDADGQNRTASGQTGGNRTLPKTIKKNPTNFTLPKTEAQFYTWFNNFNKTFIKNAKNFGFSATFLKEYKSAYNAWNRSWKSYQAAQKTYTRSQAALQTNFKSAQTLLLKYYTLILNNKANSGQFSGFGIAANPSFKPATASSTTAKKSTAKKATAKKSTAKKSTAKKAVAKKTTVKKAVAKKATSVKSTVKSTTKPVATKKVVAKKATAKKATTTVRAAKPAIKKVAAKKTTTKRIAASTPRATKTTIKKSVRSTVKPSSTVKSSSVKSSTVRKSTVRSKSVRSAKALSNLPTVSPFVKVDSSVAGKNQIWVLTAANGNSKFPTNYKPVLQFRQKGGSWHNLPVSGSFPFSHVVGNSKFPIEYRAAYLNGKQYGPWSKIATASIKAA